MITKEEARAIAINYIEERDRDYTLVDEAYFEEKKEIIFGKYDQQKKDVYVVAYEDEGYYYPNLYFLYLDAHTGEVFYTMSEHGYVEMMEED